MAAPIRPPVWPQSQALVQTGVQTGGVRPGRNDVRLTAQKAFFEAALAGKPAVAAAEPAQAQTAGPRASPTQAARSAAPAEASAPDRLPPPGSIVNILV
jgi:hypothetical protein